MWRIKIGQYYENNGQTSWMNDIKNQSWDAQLLDSFYFMSTTMFTVGYGDITPTNSLEKLFCIAYMFISTLQYSYSVNTIGLILTQMKENSEAIRQKMTCINEYLHGKKLSTELSLKVREYFNFYWNQEIIQKKNEQIKLIGLLPDDLQQRLKLDSASTLIQKCQYFKQFPNNAMQELLQYTYFNIFQPGVQINIKEHICIIESGKVQVSLHSVQLDTLNENQCFGLQELLKDIDLEYKSADFTSLLLIPRQNLKDILVKYKMNINPDKYCYICNDLRHQTQQCNVVHFIPDIEKVIMRHHFYTKTQQQNRSRNLFVRTRARFQTLNEQLLIRDSARMYQMENDIQPDTGEQIPQLPSPKVVIVPPTVSFEDEQVHLSPPDWIMETSFQNPKFMQKTCLLQQTQMLDSFKNKREKKLQLLQSGGSKTNEASILSDKIIQDYKQETLNNLQIQLPKLQGLEYEQTYYLIKYLEGLIGCTYLNDFESLAQFDKFDVSWNIDKIITKISRPIKKNTELLQQVLLKFSNYLLFPIEFVRMFRNSLIEEEDYNRNKSQVLEQVRCSVSKHFLKRKATSVIFPSK